MRLRTALAILALSTSSSAMAAYIVPIYGLINTGVSVPGSPLADNAIDPHWTLIAAPTGVVLGNAYTGARNNVFPIGPWLANDTKSRWLTPTVAPSSGQLNHVPGDYAYSISFNITPTQTASTASFTGRLAADNSVTAITLNGNTIAVPAGTNFNVWKNFAANTGFIGGLNTLVITTRNFAGTRNPTGLRVEFDSTAVTDSVPEPGTWAMMIVGFGFVGYAARRRNAVAAA